MLRNLQKQKVKPVFVGKRPKFDKKRRQSWSQLSCFDNPDYPRYSDRERWYERYVLGIKDDPSLELLFGGMIDKKIQADPKFLPELERFPEMQHELNVFYKGIELYGLADGYDGLKLRLKDDKTGKAPWTQERADKTGQLTMYLAIIYLRDKIRPEKFECQIDWMPTMRKADGSIGFAKPFKLQTFKTKRTLPQILKFLKYVEKTVKEMEKYANSKE